MKISEEIDRSPIGFGQYKFYTPNQISLFDPKYLVWAVETITNRGVLCSETLFKCCKSIPPSFRKCPPPTLTAKTLFTKTATPDQDDLPF